MRTDGKEIASEVRAQLKEQLEKIKSEYNEIPKLSTILVGDDPSSHVYVKRKEQAANELGIKFEKHTLNANVSTEEILELIEKLNNDDTCNAILVQLPLPNQDTERILQSIDPKKDVDCLHPFNIGMLSNEMKNHLLPPTVAAIMKFIEDEEIAGRKIVIIGTGKLVGLPLSIYLINKNATVITCNKHTPNWGIYTKDAEIIVSCAGVPNLIQENMVKQGAKIIDAGINKVGDSVVGDVDYENVSKKALVTPVPGGVGPVTVEMLLKNTLDLFERQKTGN